MKNKNTSSDRRSSLTLYFAGGLYLIYTAYKLLRLYLSDPEGGAGKLPFLAAALLFAAFGLYLAITAARRYRESQNAAAEETQPASPEGAEFDAVPDAALSDIAACVRSQREILARFNEAEYADSFAAYCAACGGVLRSAFSPGLTPEQVGRQLSERLLRALSEEYGSLPVREAVRLQEQDKRLMAFYLVPMVRALAMPGTGEFISSLLEDWNRAYPAFAFQAGSYEDIAAGFRRPPSRRSR